MTTHALKLLAATVLLLVMNSIAGTSEAESPNDILIIANKNVKLNAISISELKQIFLKKKISWSNGKRIISINARSSSSIRQQFRQKVCFCLREIRHHRPVRIVGMFLLS